MEVWQRPGIERGVAVQNRRAKCVVSYPKLGTTLCALALRLRVLLHKVGQRNAVLPRFVADHVTYSFETTDRREAEYLAAVLNSPTVDSLIKPMQARGLWGPRDIHKKVWELPIPEFNESGSKHRRLAEIAEACALKVKDMIPSLSQLFEDARGPHAIGRARTAVRGALSEELAKIDGLVKEVLE